MEDKEKDKPHDDESPASEDPQGNQDEQDEYSGPSDPSGGEPTGPGGGG